PLDKDELVLGLLAAPGLPTEIAEELAADLPPLLAERVTDAVPWRLPALTEPEATHLTSGVDAIDLGRERMLRHGWDLAVCVTDAPLRIGRRPIVADASATHGVALISLPALGAMQTRRRARDAVIRLVDGLVGESLETGHSVAGGAGRGGGARVGRRLGRREPRDRTQRGGTTRPRRAAAGRARGTDPRGRGARCRRRGPAFRRRGRAREPSATDRHDPRQPALAPDRAPLARARGRCRGGGAGTRDLRPLDALGRARLDPPTRAHGAVGRRDGALADRVAPPVGAAAGAGQPRADRALQRRNDAHAAAGRRVPLRGAVRDDALGGGAGHRQRRHGAGARA